MSRVSRGYLLTSIETKLCSDGSCKEEGEGYRPVTSPRLRPRSGQSSTNMINRRSWRLGRIRSYLAAWPGRAPEEGCLEDRGWLAGFGRGWARGAYEWSYYRTWHLTVHASSNPHPPSLHPLHPLLTRIPYCVRYDVAIRKGTQAEEFNFSRHAYLLVCCLSEYLSSSNHLTCTFMTRLDASMDRNKLPKEARVVSTIPTSELNACQTHSSQRIQRTSCIVLTLMMVMVIIIMRTLN